MNLLNHDLASIVGTTVRFCPWPCRTGLIESGVMTQ